LSGVKLNQKLKFAKKSQKINLKDPFFHSKSKNYLDDGFLLVYESSAP